MHPLLLIAALVGCTPPLDTADTGGDEPPLIEESPDHLLILCADPLIEVGSDYADYRYQTGWEVEALAMSALSGGEGTLAESVTAYVASAHELLPEDRELFVLIIGDADLDDPDSTDQVPLATGPLGYLGDTPHVDLDGDGVPDLAVGRLPFDDSEQVRDYLERVQVYESGYAPGAWNRRVGLFTGEGGFGDLVDGLLEYVAGQVVEQLSYDFDFTVTTNIPGSDYYLPWDAWQREYVRQHSQGLAYQPYLGHTVGDLPFDSLEEPARRGLVAYYSCSDGAIQDEGGQESESLGETLLAHPYGPMAVIGATTVSHPYGNAILAREASLGMLNERASSYGELLRQAKHDMVYGADEFREQLDEAAAVFIEGLPEIIDSHVTMYLLLGDPCLSPQLPAGQVLLDEPAEDLAAGDTPVVSGLVSMERHGLPFEGEVLVTLEVNRSTIIHELAKVHPDCLDLDACLDNLALANDHLLAEASGTVVDGRFAVELTLPAELPDSEFYFLRALAWDAEGDATGFVEVDVD